MADPARSSPTTPQAVAATAQSRGGGSPEPPPLRRHGMAERFEIGTRVVTAQRTRPYERSRDDPVYRPLRIFSLDPAASRLDGAIAVVNVPYEPLEKGPAGRLFRVLPEDADGRRYRSVDLDSPANLIRNGRSPSVTDPEFHQQMAYAVCSLTYAVFRRALGRDVAWAIDRVDEDGRTRLVLCPHGGVMRNAYYDRDEGRIVFGYFPDRRSVDGGTVDQGHVFTALSHDIVAHEATHALLDGLRSSFTVPTGPDVLAFHEAFADLVALFLHFSYRTVVEAAVASARGELALSKLLLGLARQFGDATGRNGPLRRAIDLVDPDGVPPQYHKAGTEPHERGALLVAAVFEAFLTVFRHKTSRYVRLATGGTGIVSGELPHELKAVLAEEAGQLADQFLTICIRAIDYCPPVDLEFGEFLRAVITADYELVPDDPHAYREAWIDAFRRRGIIPPDVPGLAEDALLWQAPDPDLPAQPDLAFRHLAFDGDPGRPADADELVRQARALGRLVTSPEGMASFGLASPGDSLLGRDRVEPPVIQSIRSARRIGPDGQILFDLVGEITQRRLVRGPGCTFAFLGGATVILDPRGAVRYAIVKSVLSSRRLMRQQAFLESAAGGRFWERSGTDLVPRDRMFKMCHGEGS